MPVPFLSSLRSFFDNRAMNKFYLSKAIFSVGDSLISLFLPLYFFKLGYSLTNIFLFYAILNLVHGLLVIPAVKACRRLGVVKVFLGGIITYIVCYVLLYTIHGPEQYQLFYFLALLWGSAEACFWTGYHLYLARYSDTQKNARELSTIKTIGSVFSSLGPFIAGFFITFLDFKFLFLVASVLLILSTYPLFQIPEIFLKTQVGLRGMFTTKRMKEFLGFSLAWGSEANISGTVWPLFIITSGLVGYLSLGAIFSFSFIFLLFFTQTTGYFADKYKKVVLRTGTVAMSGLNVVRAFFTSTGNIFTLNFLSKISSDMLHIPFDSFTYQRAKDSDINEYITFREFTINLLGNFPFFLLAALFPNFQFLFLLAAVVGLLYLLF